MSSLWTDLLFLHGYITDHAFARRLANTTEPPLEEVHREQAVHVAKTKRARYYARLCLGIGDGVIHAQ